jgi:hypothetical protein
MKSILKRILFICSIFILSTTALSYAGTLIKKVYFSGFPIYVDGEEYSSQNPILSYQDRTYMPLREFAEMLGVKVDFEDGKIYLKTPDIYENNERKDDGIEEEKGSLSYSENESLAENNVSSITENTSNDNVVYISKSGTKYHKIKQCTKANYSPITLSEALQKGYTACLRCYKQ